MYYVTTSVSHNKLFFVSNHNRDLVEAIGIFSLWLIFAANHTRASRLSQFVSDFLNSSYMNILLHFYLVAIVLDIVFKAKVFVGSDHGIATRTNRDVVSAPHV